MIDTYLTVDTGWIVSTSMQQNNGLFRNLGNILQGTGKVKTTRFRIIVSVLFYVETRPLKNGNMIAPGRCGLVDVLWALMKVAQKSGTNCERAIAGNALYGCIQKIKKQSIFSINVIIMNLFLFYIMKNSPIFG